MKFAGLAVFLLLGACAVDKTPLTPLGELNVCLRDTALEAKENGDAERFGNTAAAQKTARFCLEKKKVTDPFLVEVAYRNAAVLFSESTKGTSLR